MLWQEWWVWLVAGIALAVLEVIVPGYVFLGFAVGAVVMAVLVGIGITPGLPLLALFFALASLVAWLVLRRIFGVRRGQVKIWDRDINEN